MITGDERRKDGGASWRTTSGLEKVGRENGKTGDHELSQLRVARAFVIRMLGGSRLFLLQVTGKSAGGVYGSEETRRCGEASAGGHETKDGRFDRQRGGELQRTVISNEPCK
ncbi:hypothetical protein PUN28_009825 [Cardiocondyla obscurior]|uniref:Uncharacterized protein n=1 Tax=Cardiocondyla obscurior TaxID=286306 RepID=A0AAW2F3D7_9HYME